MGLGDCVVVVGSGGVVVGIGGGLRSHQHHYPRPGPKSAYSSSCYYIGWWNRGMGVGLLWVVELVLLLFPLLPLLPQLSPLLLL